MTIQNMITNIQGVDVSTMKAKIDAIKTSLVEKCENPNHIFFFDYLIENDLILDPYSPRAQMFPGNNKSLTIVVRNPKDDTNKRYLTINEDEDDTLSLDEDDMASIIEDAICHHCLDGFSNDDIVTFYNVNESCFNLSVFLNMNMQGAGDEDNNFHLDEVNSLDRNTIEMLTQVAKLDNLPIKKALDMEHMKTLMAPHKKRINAIEEAMSHLNLEDLIYEKLKEAIDA